VLSLRLIPPFHASSPWTRPPRRRRWPRPRSSRTQREPSCPAARWHILHTAVASASPAVQRLTANSQSRAHARDARERTQVDFQQLQTNPSRHTREAQYNSANTQDSLRGRRPARCLPPPPVPLPTMSLHHDRGRPGHTHPIKVTLLLWVLPCTLDSTELICAAAVESRDGYMYCGLCQDFIYDPDLEVRRLQKGRNANATPCRAC
jgi:hypothetical protein